MFLKQPVCFLSLQSEKNIKRFVWHNSKDTFAMVNMCNDAKNADVLHVRSLAF